MTIDRFARTEVVTATADTPAAELARLMKEEQVGSVVVVDGERPIGIVTDRDLVVYVMAAGGAPGEVTARDVMSEDLFAVEADDGVFATMSRMQEAGVRRVPVTEDGTLVGIVTLDDLLVVLANELSSLAGVVEGEMAPPREVRA